MSKLILKNDDGTGIEVKEISNLGEGEILILHLCCVYSPEVIENVENVLSKKFDRKVVVLDGKFSETIRSI